ncbi:MAG: HAMP domain-containing protein [Nitrospirae bacterium]|nr:HAMP domain-containing protein [Nitrospirota bacterium]
MLTVMQNTAKNIASWARSFSSPWWGGIGCRVAIIMSLAVLVVSVFISAFLLWEGSRSRESEIRSRSLFIGGFFSALAAEEIITGDRRGLDRKLTPAFLSQGNVSRDLLYLRVYDRVGRFLTGSMPRGHNEDRSSAERDLDSDVVSSVEPRFQLVGKGVYDLVMPVVIDDARVGFVKVGISRHGFQQQSGNVTKKAISAGAALLLLGLVLSKVIAAGITRPIAGLSAAVDGLGRQDWKAPVPVRGRDELSRLAHAFNQMAQTLKERETSLSRGNRDLFILHNAGLDLMESLDLEALLGKIAARAEELVKADTTAVTAMDHATRSLQYLGVTGSRAHLLKGLDLPLEAGGIYNWTASYGTPLLIQDAQTDFRLDPDQMRSLGISSLITVPLWSSSTLMAMITVMNKRGGDVFDKQDLRLFTVFANLAGAALQNAFLYTDLKHKINELNSTQQQLVHSTKMAAIGELAANVAHEINNPLTSVLGYTSHLLKTLEIPEESRQKLRIMEQETLRVRKIIRNLLDFSRQRASWMQPGDVVQPLRETVLLLHGAAEGASVRIIEEYPAFPVTVNMDHNEIKQVFINIVNNALHAMRKGGELRVRVDAGRDGETAIVFSDTGNGIPRENLKKIFDPFFSTKGNDDGTGLGLSISYRIVQNHGGRIEVESELGRGSRFRVILPSYEHRAVKE